MTSKERWIARIRLISGVSLPRMMSGTPIQKRAAFEKRIIKRKSAEYNPAPFPQIPYIAPYQESWKDHWTNLPEYVPPWPTNRESYVKFQGWDINGGGAYPDDSSFIDKYAWLVGGGYTDESLPMDVDYF